MKHTVHIKVLLPTDAQESCVKWGIKIYIKTAPCWSSTIFTVVPFVLILLKFYYKLMHKRVALKGVLKFTLK
jgi:hypothetical protein